MTEVQAMTTASAALFALITPNSGEITRAETDGLYAATIPIHDAIAVFLAHVAEIQNARRLADAVEDDAHVFIHFEKIKQTADAAETLGREVLNGIDRLRDAAFQLDHYAAEITLAIEGTSPLARLAHTAGDRVVMSVAEHAHLLERAALAENASAATTTTNGGGVP